MPGTGKVIFEQTVSAPLPITCLGCEAVIPWDGTGAFAYTCSCGATVFHRGFDLMPPASLVLFIASGGRPPEGAKPDWQPPHIDYWLGKSERSSRMKESLINGLRQMGCTWTRECHDCSRKERERAKAEADMRERIGRTGGGE